MQSLSVLALTLVFLSQQVSGKDALPQPQIFADPAGPNYNTNERNPLPLNGACQTLDSYFRRNVGFIYIPCEAADG
ncbi:hypothetical protein PENSTE_c011G00515 [Penicillium steckii]|uniref:Uncharacterized protein n=1 Tax=Penicillium steckii TaxID=303698 RepID=A0A1V6T6R2_9EURO|nr:hypothetical protein PENSTE_c011G00515 [Penicillium steckii]